MAARIFTSGLTQENLVTQERFYDKLKSLSQKNNSNKTKHFVVANELKKLQKIGRSHFKEDGTQNFLVLIQPLYRYFKRVAGVGSGNYIYFWKCKGLYDEILQFLLQLIIASFHS